MCACVCVFVHVVVVVVGFFGLFVFAPRLHDKWLFHCVPLNCFYGPFFALHTLRGDVLCVRLSSSRQVVPNGWPVAIKAGRPAHATLHYTTLHEFSPIVFFPDKSSESEALS